MKTAVADLAILGGSPEFAQPLHVGKPNLGDGSVFLGRVQAALDRGWLANDGPLVREFEERIAELAGVRHCVAVCNGTVALEIAQRVLGMQGEVIVPSFTFVATVHSLLWQGLTPVFGDIDGRTHNLDPGRIETLITPRTTAILAVHLWGRSCDVAAIGDIAARHGLSVLYDASHALACTLAGDPVASRGDAATLSFHATKVVHSAEGGAIVTDDGELARRMRLMRNFGFDGYDSVVSLGTNGKMSELCAAMGLASLDHMPFFIAANRSNHAVYREELDGVRGLRLLSYDEAEGNNWQYVVVEIADTSLPIGRDRILEALHAENVLARRYFYPGCHRLEPYRTLYPEAGRHLPETEAVASRVLCLPTGVAIGADDVRRICRIIRLMIDNAGTLADRLPSKKG